MPNQTLLPLFRGALKLDTDKAGGVMPLRLTDAQLARYQGIPAACYPYCPAGIKLDVVTDRPEIAFDYRFGRVFFENPRFDVYEDGYFAFCHETRGEDGRFSYRRRAAKPSRVTVYLPVTAEVRLCGLDPTDLAPAPRPDKRMIVFGDSICQGLMGAHPSQGVIPIVERLLGYDALNQSVGGETYDPAALDETLSAWNPDRIVVALGTNDFAMTRDVNVIFPNIDRYYEKLRRVFPTAPVCAITPPAILDLVPGSTDARLLDDIIAGVDERARAAGFAVLCGKTALPALPDFYTDHAHPNDLGFHEYALTLAAALRE